ncbi:aromatic amino acid aminotransferase [Halobacteriales archaeon QS_8_69_26]|nr:MAG: aromatic amino acid aminotransferase [Halobacteriales archaeon QS_8_69_26]
MTGHSDRVDRVPPSGIRRFFELTEEVDDVISLGVGEPDFAAPRPARDAAIEGLERGRTSYTANRGMAELRELVAEDYARFGPTYDPGSEVLVTTGVSEAVDVGVRALVDAGESVAVAQPAYVSYVPCVRFAGAEVVDVHTRRADGFRLTPEALRAAGADEAEALILCYPNNPTGAVMDRDELAEVAAFARDHDLTVISDEVYADLRYDGDHVSVASLPGMRERTVVLGGFSKAYAMTGLRLGYALGPEEAVAAMTKVHQYVMLSAPTPAQHAGIEALRSCRPDLEEMRERYDRRRRFVLSRLDGIGIDCFEARGAFYVFPECPADDAGAFAEELLREAGVAVVPGGVFGDAGEGHLRMSYAAGMDDLREAMDRIESFLG